MSLINGVLIRLNSPLPLVERCKFAREICDRPGITFTYKESLIINWLLQELNKEVLSNAVDIWSTLNYVLEQANKKGKGNSCLLLKNTFADVVLDQVSAFSFSDKQHDNRLAKEIIKCLSVLLSCQSTSHIFLKQPNVLLKILSGLLDVINYYIRSRNVPEDILSEFLAVFKLLTKNESLSSEKVSDTLIQDCLQTFVTFVELSESHNEKEGSILIVKWLKDVICHPRLNQAYKVVLKLDDSKNNQVSTIRALFKRIQNFLQSDCEIKMIGPRLMTIILQGMFEKLNQSSFDLPFSILVYFSKLSDQCEKTSSLVLLNQLLAVCSRHPELFLRNGSITSSAKTNWFREQINSVINGKHIHTDLLTFFELLLTINPEITDPHLEQIWSSLWLNSSGTTIEAQSNLLCTLLKTYIRLRQIPKLFSKLVSCVKKLSSSPDNDNLFPRQFSVQFSECVVSLPAGQTLELWQSLLDAVKFMYLDSNWKFPSIVDLFSVVLLHAKLTECDFPASKHSELKELLHNTMLFLQSVLKKNSTADSEILNLCFAWGEVVLMLKLYHSNADSLFNFAFPDISSDLFDITVLHPYLSAEEWKLRLSKVETTDEKLASSLVSLMIQKARCSTILGDLDCKQDVNSRISKYVYTYIYDRFHEDVPKSENILFHFKDSAVSWLPFLLPEMRYKKLAKLSQITIKSVVNENLKHDNSMARSMIKMCTAFEIRPLQTALLTSLWEEAGNSICLKRKCDEYNNDLVWKFLSKHSQSRQEISSSAETVESKMSQEIEKAAVKFNEQCQNDQQIGRIVNTERAIQIVHILCLFPLENIEPENQLRCVLGLFQLFAILGSKGNKTSELCVIICQTLLSLMSKMPSSRMTMFFDVDVLLPKVFNRLKCSETAEERKWNMSLLERLVYICTGNTDTQVKIENFARQLFQGNGTSVLETEVLQIIIMSFLTILKRYKLSNSVELFQKCDPVVQTLVASLSKKLLSIENLDLVLVWRCLSCILIYHCRSVPDHFQVSKRRPKKFLKKHLMTVETLMTVNQLADAKTSQYFYELVGILSKNRSQFEDKLSEELFLNTWNTILNHLTISKFNVIAQKPNLDAISSLLRCYNPTELSVALHKLNSHGILLMEFDKSQVIQIIPLWNVIINTEFGPETPREVGTGIAQFLNLLLPMLRLPLDKSSGNVDVILPALKFIANILQKPKVTLRHSQIVMCFQTCTSLNLSALEPAQAIPLCDLLLTIYRRLFARASKVVLQSVAPFLSALSTVLKQLIRTGNQKLFHQYSEELKKDVVLCAQEFAKLLAIMVNHRTEFCKQAGFLISDYVFEIENTTVHPLVKEQVLLGLYKILDVCDGHVTAMLQISLPPGGQEILKQLHSDFTQHFRYRGKV